MNKPGKDARFIHHQAAADAASAKRDAAAAKSAAESAANSAQETNEKLDRMFKKSMYK